MAVGTRLFFDMMKKPPPKVLLFGDACSEVTAAVAESTPYWNICQLSYADTSPVLSDRTTFPAFYRTVPSDSDFNPARIQFLRHFNWTRVGTLFQDASHGSSRYSHAHNKLIELLDSAHIERVTESFSNDPGPALLNLKSKDARIIIGNFDEEMARKVFCNVYQQNMFGSRYVWLLLGEYQKSWWETTDGSITCSKKQMRQVTDGYFSTDVLELSTTGQTTQFSITSEQYKSLYNDRRGTSYSKFHGYAYDGVWVIARAIDVLLSQNGGRVDRNLFNYDRIHATLNDTNFIGVTGRVMFTNGDRIGGIVIQQKQDGDVKKIGEYDALTHSLDLMKGTPIVWQSEFGAPRDRSLRELQLEKVNLTIYVILCVIASLGIVLALSFLAINIKFRKHSYIKMSSPNLNNLIIVGCIFAYTSVFLLGTDGGMINPKYYHTMCITRSWVLCVGFTLSFGAMFSKTWRVHTIFTNIKLNKKVIKDYQLFLIVAVLFSVDIIILTVWQSVNPIKRETKELPPRVLSEEGDKEIVPVIEFCISDNREIWLGVIYAYKGIFMLIGCFLAWETRHVSIPALNDSKYIGMSVYNIVIMCVSGVPISFIIKDETDESYLIIALFIIFCTTITLCLVFGPKIIELRKDPVGDDKRIRATFRRNPKAEPCETDISLKIRKLADEVYRRRQVLDNLSQEVEELTQQLDEEDVKPPPVVDLQPLTSLKSLRESAGSLGTLCTEEQSLLEPATASTVLSHDNHNASFETEDAEPCDGVRPPNNSPELIELNHIRSMKHRRRKLKLENCVYETQCTNTSIPPTYEEVMDRPQSVFMDGMRTPSYQGLKLLNLEELHSLKETAILSDDSGSELSLASSLNSLPDDEEADVTRSLLH